MNVYDMHKAVLRQIPQVPLRITLVHAVNVFIELA